MKNYNSQISCVKPDGPLLTSEGHVTLVMKKYCRRTCELLVYI